MSAFFLNTTFKQGSHLLKQVRLLDPSANIDQAIDVWIENGTLKQLGSQLSHDSDNTQVHDAQRWLLGPALVDLYAHSGEPGYEQRETLQSLTQSALGGGFARVGLLPSTDPALDSVQALNALQAKTKDIYPSPQWLPLAALTQGIQGQTLTELGELASSSIAGFCEDRPLPSLMMVQRILEYLQPYDKPLLLWAWDPSQVGDGLIYEGEESLRLGLKGIPMTAETSRVAGLIELVRRTPTPVHLMRISSARSVELLAQAQAEGLPITASVTWMHLLLSDQDIRRYDYHPALRLDPPLGSEANRQALVEGVQAGILTAIATDHQAHTFEEKTLPFGQAPAGAVGLEFALPLLWDQLVQTGSLSPLALWGSLSQGPLHCLGQTLVPIQSQLTQPLVLFDPDQTWIVDSQTVFARPQSTPWWGHRMRGKVTEILHLRQGQSL